jgi:hypothetical protein
LELDRLIGHQGVVGDVSARALPSGDRAACGTPRDTRVAPEGDQVDSRGVDEAGVPANADVGGVADPGRALQLPERAVAGQRRERAGRGVRVPLRALGVKLQGRVFTWASDAELLKLV